ncbi:cutinase family protein [Mycolicibacterium sp.]|uniref:cutinase family protein n=1 Tax=Mycolicibacterium sp. TaxID=2320850 RepID=UPI001A1E3175|nr:cutinase family protein [Mycolicibacterium sp.]MBJ7339334.1 cutinase family protein [Mycolicibacterium sp.]
MNTRHLPRLLGAAVVSAGAALSVTAAPSASAAPCSDVALVFARGTGEAPGVGGVGQSYVDALRAQLGTRTLDVYPVNYAASGDFENREAFASTVIDGVRDAGAHVQSTAENCPNTKIVLGGYSQGAIVAGYVTANQVPAGVPASAAPAPLPASVSDKVAAVTLFGTPSAEFLKTYDAPELNIGPNYSAKTLELCAQGDAICDGTPGGQPGFAHISYGFNGMTGEAATYAVDRIAPAPNNG